MTQDTEDVVARLRVQARHEETASKMMADAKTARQTDREDAWTDAGYSWTTTEQTASWRAADLIQSLSDRIDVLSDALDAIKELADADDAFLCWKTANDALAALHQEATDFGAIRATHEPSQSTLSRPYGRVSRLKEGKTMSYENPGNEFEELIETRIGRDFDGECHLTADEARAVLDLINASQKVFAGLNARIDAAGHSSVPVFDGIAELNDALRRFEPEEVEDV